MPPTADHRPFTQAIIDPQPQFGNRFKSKKSKEKQIGPTCEKKLLLDFYKKRQITIDDILRKGECDK